MSAKTPNEIARRRSYANHSVSVEIDYLVECTAVSDGIDAAIAAVEGIAGPQGYDLDSSRGQHVNRNPLWFKVTAVWKLATGADWQLPPLERPSILSASYNVMSVPYFKDADGMLVVNSAGDPFDPMPQRQTGLLQLQITINLATFPVIAFAGLAWSVNADQVTIKGTSYAAKTLLFMPPSVQEQWETVNKINYHFYQTTFRLAADADGHAQKIVQRGYREIVSSGGKPMTMVGGDGVPLTQPWPLDASGKALEAGATPVIVTFKPYQAKSWNINFG